MLFDPTTFGVTAVLDWEWTHPGEPVEDLAWCEWIIRMHHPSQVNALDGFFDAYGHRPSRIAGRHVTSASFGEAGEASVYYYLHHRFETINLELVEQRGRSLRAVATVSGDVDGLGIDPVRVDAWLTFTGILVSLHDATSPDVALARLGQFTDASGLTFDPDSGEAALRFIAQPG